MPDPAADISRLERDFPVSYAIFAMARTHRAIAAARLSELGLYPNQELTLVQLGAGDGLPQNALAEALRVSHVTVAKMISRMERVGLVERRSSTTDRRMSLVYLTPQGRELSAKVLDVWAGLEAATTRELDQRLQTQFLAATETIRRSLEDSAGSATQPA